MKNQHFTLYLIVIGVTCLCASLFSNLYISQTVQTEGFTRSVKELSDQVERFREDIKAMDSRRNAQYGILKGLLEGDDGD